MSITTIKAMADAIVAKIVAAEAANAFPSKFATDWGYALEYEPNTLLAMKCSVIPGPRRVTGAARKTMQVDYDFDIVVEKHFNTKPTRQQSSEVVAVAQMIPLLFRHDSLISTGIGDYAGESGDPVMDPDRISEQNTASSVVTLTFRVWEPTELTITTP